MILSEDWRWKCIHKIMVEQLALKEAELKRAYEYQAKSHKEMYEWKDRRLALTHEISALQDFLSGITMGEVVK